MIYLFPQTDNNVSLIMNYELWIVNYELLIQVLVNKPSKMVL